jgi:hypothetical protein
VLVPRFASPGRLPSGVHELADEGCVSRDNLVRLGRRLSSPPLEHLRPARLERRSARRSAASIEARADESAPPADLARLPIVLRGWRRLGCVPLLATVIRRLRGCFLGLGTRRDRGRLQPQRESADGLPLVPVFRFRARSLFAFRLEAVALSLFGLGAFALFLLGL